MSRIIRKPDFCICENKGADQLRSSCEADQGLSFRCMDRTIPLLHIAKISSFQLSSALVRFVLDWSETSKTGFLAPRLMYGVRESHRLVIKHQTAGTEVGSWNPSWTMLWDHVVSMSKTHYLQIILVYYKEQSYSVLTCQIKMLTGI